MVTLVPIGTMGMVNSVVWDSAYCLLFKATLTVRQLAMDKHLWLPPTLLAPSDRASARWIYVRPRIDPPWHEHFHIHKIMISLS